METDEDFEEIIKMIDDIYQKLKSIYAGEDHMGSREQRTARDACTILQLAREVLLSGGMQ